MCDTLRSKHANMHGVPEASPDALQRRIDGDPSRRHSEGTETETDPPSQTFDARHVYGDQVFMGMYSGYVASEPEGSTPGYSRAL
jgi:hypothetical protein